MKIVEIGGYPPPYTGWSVRIKFLRLGFEEQGDDCKVLNLGKNRKIQSSEYIDVQNGVDYLKKLFWLSLSGYYFHIHMNGQAIKGPILALIAQMIAIICGRRAVLTFHGGIEQLYFPRRNAGRMFWLIYLNFLLAKMIICNNSSVKNKICEYGSFVKSAKVKSIPAFSIQYLNYREVKLPEALVRFLNAKQHTVLCYLVLRNGFFIETVVEFLKQCPENIGVILTGIAKMEDKEIEESYNKILFLSKKGNVFISENLDHNTFMTLLTKCSIYLRTPVSDGVASSVLEALSQNVPVVASENHRRPHGVITYAADDAKDLMQKVNHTLLNLESIKSNLERPKIDDTLNIEIMSLKNCMIK